jgi:hypothetical protein
VFLPKGPSIEERETDNGWQRKLVYYTDSFLPVINSIIDNPYCASASEWECAIVDSTVCVVLEEGDDEEAVQAAILDGIAAAVLDGSFVAAIPPENMLPDGSTSTVDEST